MLFKRRKQPARMQDITICQLKSAKASKMSSQLFLRLTFLFLMELEGGILPLIFGGIHFSLKNRV